MGGIGKTTLAEEVFHQLQSEYEGCCFLENIREESAKHGMVFLKEKLISALLDEVVKVDTANRFPHYVKTRIRRMKVLIVLDDVNDSDQLEILFGDHDLFGFGSRIIITTRDKQMLSKDVDDIFEVGALDYDKSLELFNLNAFKGKELEIEYNELSKRVVDYAKGIPLVLKVLAHLVCGKDKLVWESQLDKLRKMPSKKVQDVMRLSYDDLDREEQKIFLDIACFFNGSNLKVDYLKLLWKDSESDNSVVSGLERLKDKDLISISKHNVISMHGIIQDIGREIVRQESSGDPGSRSRLWDDDIYEVLKNDKGTEEIRSIWMPLPTLRKMKLSPSTFSKMRNLQFLYVPNVYDQDGFDLLPQGLHSMPPELRYLCWMHYPLKSLPDEFSAEKLVILDLSYSQVEKLWHGMQNLLNLKEVLKLFYSRFLKELPDFSKALNLEVLDMHFCGQLTSVHPSIFSLEKLEKLDLSHCTSLTKLTSDTHSSSLRYISLKFCKNIRKFSVTSENMIELDLQYTQINALPASFGRQTKLEILHIGNCSIESFPSCFKNLIRLQYLDIRYCLELQTLPELRQSLEVLHVRGCTSLEIVLFPSIPEQFKENRNRVVFANCLKLDEHSLTNIVLNAQINIMKFAYQHVSASDHDFHNKFNDYKDHNDSYQALYAYPGNSVPKWFEYMTTTDYVVIDLSSSTSRSPLLGFIFCFVLGGNRLIVAPLKFNITICDLEDQGKEEEHFELCISRPSASIVSDRVFMIYDKQCSCYLNSKAKDMTRFEIKVTTRLSSMHPIIYSGICMELKGFGVNVIDASAYHSFIQTMRLPD